MLSRYVHTWPVFSKTDHVQDSSFITPRFVPWRSPPALHTLLFPVSTLCLPLPPPFPCMCNFALTSPDSSRSADPSRYPRTRRAVRGVQARSPDPDDGQGYGRGVRSVVFRCPATVQDGERSESVSFVVRCY